MQHFKRILVATDTRLAEHPIVNEAAELARLNHASLKIVDVVPDFPWTVRLTLSRHEHIRGLIVGEKQASLEALASPIRATGVDVQTKVLLGKTSVETIREVLRGEHDLVMRVAKGSDSTRKGYFGNTAIRLLRKCPCPVWLVAPGTTTTFKHVLGCVDTSAEDSIDAELNDQIYKMASAIRDYHTGRLSIVHAWSIWNASMFKSRLTPQEFAEMEKSNHEQVSKLLGTFLKNHGRDIQDPTVHLIQGETASVISGFVRNFGVDLVVMGTVARSGVEGVLMGNTAERILDRIQCSVLALKSSTFACPIHLNE